MSLAICRQPGEKQQKPNYPSHHSLPICKNSFEVSEHINQQIFGKSTITSLIHLKIDIKDALGSTEKEESFRIASNNFITRIKTFFNSASRAMLNLEPLVETPNLPSSYTWRLQFSNIGNENFQPTRIGFEDPRTGQLSCESGDLTLVPCNLDLIEAQSSKDLEIILLADYSTSAYKKTLVFESGSHKQRFPLVISTDLKVLDFASHFKRSPSWQIEWITSISLLLFAVVTLTWK
jgi:hypothetical protein